VLYSKDSTTKKEQEMITVKNLMQTSAQSSPDGQHWEPALPQYVGLRVRLSDAWAVLMGKATAVRQTNQADVFYGDRIVLPKNPKDPLIVIKGGMNPAATQPAPMAGPSGDCLSDFQEGQWWLAELDAAVANGTQEQKRAVSVVRNLLATLAANTTLLAQPAAIAAEREACAKVLVKIAQFLGVVRVYAQDIQPKHELETDKPLHWKARELQDEVIRMLDTTSPAQIAEPLTDEQLLDILRGIDSDAVRLAPGFKAFAKAIESAHGITKGQE
jgi:hypothetical protein